MPKQKKTAGSAESSAKTTMADAPADIPVPAPVVQQSPLLKLPQEVKQKIWKFAVKFNYSVKPVQVMPRSNKFLWSSRQVIIQENQHGALVKIKNVDAVKQLTVVALSRTCHQIYDEVSLTNLFYQVNHFDFRKSDDESVLAYLVAITDARRDNIQCVSMVWPLYDADSMAVIASCVKLKDFALHLPKEFVMYACFKRDNLVSFQEVKRAVQGLKKFKLILFNESKVEETKRAAYKEEMKLFTPVFRNLRTTLNEQVAIKRDTNLGLARLHEAYMAASLDIHGRGRLGPDKKPTVSSRTRNQLKNAEKADKYGIIPQRQQPKYDVTGELVWNIYTIKECREVLDDRGSVSTIEYLCVIRTLPYYALEDSWEDFSVLGTSLYSLRSFYIDNQSACGKQFVLEMLKIRAADENPDEKRDGVWPKRTTDLIKTLKRIIRFQAKHEAKAAQAAAKKAKKEAAEAKKVGLRSA